MGRPTTKQLAPFGERLRAAIERSEFSSRAAFVRHHDLEGATLYRYETGEREPPLDLVRSFAASLGTTVAELAGERPVEETTLDRDDATSPYPDIEAFIADEARAGRPIEPEFVAKLRGVRFKVELAVSLYDTAAALLAQMRAAARGKALPKQRIRPGG